MFLHLANDHPASTPRPPTSQLQLVNLSRRHILGGLGGLTIGLTLAACSPKETKTAKAPPAEMPDNSLAESGPSLLIAIAADGRVQIRSPRSEMGQQALTSVAQMVADELDVEWDKVELAQAIGHPKYGDQNTDGSTTVRNNMARFQMAGASMRQMLVQAAADQWDVDPSECSFRTRRHHPHIRQIIDLWRCRKGRRKSGSAGRRQRNAERPERLALYRSILAFGDGASNHKRRGDFRH